MVSNCRYFGQVHAPSIHIMMVKKYTKLHFFMVSTTRQLSTFFLEWPLFSAPRTNLLSSPLLPAYLMTGGLLCLKHKLYPFFCLDHRYCLHNKIMTDFFMSSLLYLNRWYFMRVSKYVYCFNILFVLLLLRLITI